MKVIDAVITLDKYDCISSIKSNSDYFKKSYEKLLSLHIGTLLSNVFEIDLNKNSGVAAWNDEFFYYEIIKPNKDFTHIFIKKNIPDSLILEKILDTLDDGIQVYDQNANLVYYNPASSAISLKNHDKNILGQHLTDVFSNVDEKYSTILTTLNTKSPVINRCDTFETNSGKLITTINTGHPIFFDNHLIGSLLIERDLFSLQKTISKLSSMKDLIYSQNDPDKFTNKDKTYTFDDLIGNNIEFKKSVNLAKKVSTQDCNILLYGETGTGKELFAQSIHNNSDRFDKKFVELNCAAVPETLIEGVLFGTTKGAFTGSIDRAGLFEEANGGTIFLDELNSMSLSMQSKLLRFLQDGTFRRIGGKKNIKSDVRIISSCNEDPFYITNNNILRKDLFYRVSTIIIEIPPLRKRNDDISLLLEYFISTLGHKYLKKIQNISAEVLEILNNYNWPGNVRELMHVVEYALNTIDGNTFDITNLPKHLFPISKNDIDNTFKTIDTDILDNDLQSIMDTYECEVIKTVLHHHGYNITQAANALNIKRQSLQYRIKKYGIVL